MVRVTGEEGSCNYTETEVPVCNTLTYNGDVQILINSSSSYTLINNTGTNAGSYNITLDLEDGYKWSDGSTSNKVISCDIDKYDVEVTALDQSIKYGSSISNNSNYISVSSLINGHTLSSYNLVSSIYDVGTGTINASNVKLADKW